MNKPDTVVEPILEQEEENQIIAGRRAKLNALRERGQAYPNDWKRDHLALDIQKQYQDHAPETLEQTPVTVAIAGRLMTRRLMGKASFVHLQDMSGRIQLYIARDQLSPEVYDDFKTWDLGDIIAAKGFVFKTKTGELSIKVQELRLLTKSLRPLPDKFHGLTDQEQRFRQRYLDLLVNERARRVFQLRSQLITALRQFLNQAGFLEVETPMMQPQPGGAAAKPFMTHHNALDMDLFLRIAPELYLKRLVVGGLEKVYEINRNFRNEGISTRHNPEFTMLEFYTAYATYEDLMQFTEALLRHLALTVLGSLQFNYQEQAFDLTQPFQRLTIQQAITQYCPELTADLINDEARTRAWLADHHISVPAGSGLGRLQMALFEELVEDKLIQPTFILDFPAEVSPLARANDQNPLLTDRFELFVAGRELANGFSELNDPDDQRKRFEQQVAARASGDDEAMLLDEDYLTALEYGLPPTAGEGIGIDRLVMWLADCASIREVILFPLLRNIA